MLVLIIMSIILFGRCMLGKDIAVSRSRYVPGKTARWLALFCLLALPVANNLAELPSLALILYLVFFCFMALLLSQRRGVPPPLPKE